MFQYTIKWTHEVDNRKAGGTTLRGKFVYRDTRKYMPHQGAKERIRRLGGPCR